MLKATIIENSLADKAILNKVIINKTRVSDDWILHDVTINKSLIPELAKSLTEGPWYIHLWEDSDVEGVKMLEVTVVYRDQIFTIDYSDKNTWKEAVEYGKSIGIPEEQLDFLI